MTSTAAGERERRFAEGSRRAGDFENAQRQEHRGRDCWEVPERHVEEAL
jgi:hypothetical protein